MKLKKLIQGLPGAELKGSREIEITGLCSDSRCVAPGNLFFAKRGHECDGVKFIPDALVAGAGAIVTDLYDPSLKHVPQVVVQNVAVAEAALAASYYQQASHELFMVGVTGTSGKTTTSYYIKHILDQAAHLNTGLMGTIETICGPWRYPARLTTADVINNHKLLREMVSQGARAAVMEVSSHALQQGRTAHIAYDVVIFTNLSSEHLDYHKTMENYARAKSLLFQGLTRRDGKERSVPPCAIINADDPYGAVMAQACSEVVLTYGFSQEAMVRASALTLGDEGYSFEIAYRGQHERLCCRLLGRHNIYNLLAALATGLVYGIPLRELAAAATLLPPVRGRLEPVENPLGLKLFVDYAHKEASLRAALEALRPICRGRLIVVFGCGGNRDRNKRPRMAAVTEELADITIVTSDNPRQEPPEAIISEILSGFSNDAQICVETDRRKAIAKAISMANIDDIILIAGKGHESQQIFAHTTLPFDDRQVAQEICFETLQPSNAG